MDSKKLRPKGLMALTAAVLCASLAAGCGGSGTGAAGAGPDAGTAGAGGAPAAAPSASPAQPPGQVPVLKIMNHDSSRKLPDHVTNDSNPFVDYIKQNTGVDIRMLVSPTDGYAEKVNVTMASGDLPDLIWYNDRVWLLKMIQNKAIMPLDDLIARHGSEMKEEFPQEVWDMLTYEGKIYAVPYLFDSIATNLMYVRKDWLDKLGLQPPKTLDEYVRVFKAFRDRDPDGNGKADTLGTLIGENLNYSDPFFGAFGVQIGQWASRDGKLVYSSTLPETKKALEFMRGLYQEGLLDPEFALNKQPAIDQKVVTGKVGILPVRYTATRLSLNDSKKQDPQADWVPLEFPVGPDGLSGSKVSSPLHSFTFIPAGSQNGEAAMRMLNFNARDGAKTLALGFENEHWRMENGKFIFDDSKHTRDIYRSRYQLVNPVHKEYLKLRWDALGEEWRLYSNSDYIVSRAIKDEFYGFPTDAMIKNDAKLKTLEQQTFAKIIMGAAPLEEFDKFVQEWTRSGGEQITREVNEWYNQSKR